MLVRPLPIPYREKRPRVVAPQKHCLDQHRHFWQRFHHHGD
ncbi:hypothetical protein CY0110_15997 [Crocosphaera chwakensis CCY0110]|uniref:Uncharacterized protein n=1 Tax=Crocosphaera chwakensis CCY0110 TaxID=391612 RepID=A3IHN1_9CHRO|nr:hypothetical protein CY0110_15997 [Crocosphaera chwakensis CCY0110]